MYLGLSTVTAHTELPVLQFLSHIAPTTSEAFIILLDGLFCCSALTRARVPCCQPRNNNNNNNKLQLGCYPVAVVILHVHKI